MAKLKELNSKPYLFERLDKPITAADLDPKVLASQPASARAILERDPMKDAEAQARVVPLSAYVDKDAVDHYVKTGDTSVLAKMVGVRSMTVDEILTEEKRRRSPKNEQQINTKVWVDKKLLPPDVHLSATSAEKKESGIQAFLYSPPAQVTEEEIRQRAVNLKPIVTEQPKPVVWVEAPWYKAIWQWITGGQVRKKHED
jgi:hypothetical protein